MKTLLCTSALAAALTLAAVPAWSHEYWLSPNTYRAVPGRAVALRARTGEGFVGEAKRYELSRTVHLTARAARDFDLGVVAERGDSLWAWFAPVDRGGVLMAYESTFQPITVDSVKFERYLVDDGLDEPRAARQARGETGPGRERYRRCAKTWVAGDDAAAAATRVTRPVGMPFEIVPLAVPGDQPVLRVRVLFEGRPIAGALVHAWRQPLGDDAALTPAAARDTMKVASGTRTDADGIAEVPVADAGEWLIGAVHMEPSRDPVAEWESSWASLTFARPASGRGRTR
jgi:uncharacterized GH25 family protein